MTPTEIVNVILALKAKSQALHPKAQSINLADGPLIVSGQGPYPVILSPFVQSHLNASVITDAVHSKSLLVFMRSFQQLQISWPTLEALPQLKGMKLLLSLMHSKTWVSQLLSHLISISAYAMHDTEILKFPVRSCSSSTFAFAYRQGRALRILPI